jgi:hypothetical protein
MTCSGKGTLCVRREIRQTVGKRAADGERSKPESPGHERSLPSVQIGKSAEEEEQTSLTHGDEGLEGRNDRHTHRCEGVCRDEPLQLIFPDPQLRSDGWEGDRHGSSIRGLRWGVSTALKHELRSQPTLIIMAPAHESTKNALFIALLFFAGCDEAAPPSLLTLDALFVVCPLSLFFLWSRSWAGGGNVSPTPGAGELKSLVGETASAGSLCISMNDLST